MQDPLITITALTIGTVAAFTDVRSRRVPNVLTFGAATVAVAYHGLAHGTDGVMTAAAGWLLGVLLFLPFFALGGMGGGDVKLLAALGAWLGPRHAMWVAVYSSLAGGVMAIALALARGYLATALRNIVALLQYWRVMGLRPVPGFTLDNPHAPRLAYAIPILAGTMAALWLQ